MREGVAETHGHLEVLTARTWSRQKLATGHSHMQKKKKKDPRKQQRHTEGDIQCVLTNTI